METKNCIRCGSKFPATSEYFYANPHTAIRLDSRCKKCCKELTRIKYKNETEAQKQYQREYRIKNKNKIKTYRIKNRKHRSKTHKEYVKNNHTEVMIKTREWELANKEKRNEQARIHGMKRKAQKFASGGTITREDIHRQYNNQKGKCYYCGINVGKKYHVDHVIPLSRGGPHSPDNIVISCPSCNTHKNDKLPHEWEGSNRLL